MVDVTPNILLPGPVRRVDGTSSPECDCVNSSEESSLYTTPVSFGEPLRCAANLHTQLLSHSNALMFNPKHNGGVAVLNAAAYRMWERFRTPHSPQSLGLTHGSEAHSVVRQMVRVGLLEGVTGKTQLRMKPPRTLSAWLHVTDRCNLQCDYCYVHKTGAEMSPETGREAIDAIVRSAERGGFKRIKLKFGGGEPTLNLKLVFELHTYAQVQAAESDLELESAILSNGVAITESDIAEIKARGIRLMISLDGIGEVHDRQRKFPDGKGSFAQVERTLNRVIAHGVRPFISVLVSGRNVDSLPDTARYMLDRDLLFNLSFFRDNGCVNHPTDLKLQDKRIIEAMQRTFAVIETNLPDHSLLGSLVDRLQFDKPHTKPCGVGDSYLVIDQLGNVAKCHMALEAPVTDIYVEDPLAQVREDRMGIQNVEVDDKEDCRDCEWRYWCAGGCPVTAFRTTGRYATKSPYCQVYKAVYPDLLRLEGLRLLKLGGVTAP